MIDEITVWILTLLPTVLTIITVLSVVIKVIKDFNSLKEEITDSNRMKKIEETTKIIIQENYELKKQIKQLLESINKVKIEDIKDVSE